MNQFVLCGFVALLACTFGLPQVVKFAVDSEPPRRSKLKSYQFKNCGDVSNEILVLDNLVIGPDPLSFPGPVDVSFNGQIKSTVDSPFKASVYLAKRAGSVWVKIPCIGMVGSCLYADLCDLLSDVTCPDPFINAGVPCKCPFLQGTYNFPQAEFDVNAEVFPPGDYQGQANLTFNNAFVGCYEIFFTFG